jgi:hypothetical protein
VGYLVFQERGECCLLIDATAIARHPLFFANLLSGCGLSDDQGRRLDPLTVWQAVAGGSWQALLSAHMAEKVPPAMHAAIQKNLVIKRSVSREDGICTVFREQDGTLQVSKCPLNQTCVETLAGDPIFPGVAYDIHLRQLAARSDWQAWRQALQQFVEAVFQRFALNQDCLQGEAIDAIARNAVLDEQAGIAFFDLEFADYATPAKTFFIYRLCLSLAGRRAEYLADSGFSCLYELYGHLCDSFGLRPAYLADVRREAEFQAWVAGRPVGKVKYARGLRPFGQRHRLRCLNYRLRLLAARVVNKG